MSVFRRCFITAFPLTSFTLSTITWQQLRLLHAEVILFPCHVHYLIYLTLNTASILYLHNNNSLPNSSTSVALNTKIYYDADPHLVFFPPVHFCMFWKGQDPSCVIMYHSLLVVTASATRKRGKLPINLNKRHAVVATTLPTSCSNPCVSRITVRSFLLHTFARTLKFLQRMEIQHSL